MGSVGRLTIREDNMTFLSGVIHSGTLTRVIAALSANPRTLGELDESFMNYSEAPLTENIENISVEFPLNSKPGDTIMLYDPRDSMGLEFAVHIDLENKKVELEDTIVKFEGQVMFYRANGGDPRNMKDYKVPKAWRT